MADKPSNGDRLMTYWVTGPGAATLRWNTPGAFTRCVRALDNHVRDPQGLCAVLHQRATGRAYGQGDNQRSS